MRILLLPLLAASTLVHAELPVSPGAELTLVSEDFKFTEGPAADPEGNVYFTDQPNDRILKWSVETGKVTDFLKPAGRSNGLFFTPEGKLIACADENGELWSIDPESKEVTVLLSGFDGKLFNGPNDVWVDPGGGMFFTDPFYKRPYWEGREKPEQEKQRVYFLPKGGEKAVVVEDTLKQPNGIIGTADGTTLFVADIGARKTYRYRIGPDHSLEEKELFCEMGSDGMTLDADGNLYLTGKGVTVFDSSGKKLGEIPVPEGWTANVTFGGEEMKTLFITAMDSLYTLEMSARGNPGG